MYRMLLFALIAAVAATLASAGEVSGTASYRERIALPPQATFRASLFDISNTSQVEIGRFEAPGDAGPPYAFKIEFEDAAIVEGGVYALQAEVIWPDRAFVAAGMILETSPAETSGIALVMVRPEPTPAAGMGLLNATPEAEQMIAAHGLTLPANFEGTIRSDGREEVWALALAADQTFQLSRMFRSAGEETARRDSLGRWHADPGSGTLLLRDGAEMPLAVRPRRAGGLEVIDMASGAPFDGALARGAARPLALADMTLAGMMTYMADAAAFEECVSGLTFPIAVEGGYAPLEAAYLADRSAPGAPLYVMIEGGLDMRAAMEGPDRQMVVVDQVLRTRPGLTCARQKADAQLQNTYWRLDRLDGAPIPSGAGQQEPHIVLEAGEAPAYRGTLGCNRLRGGYGLEGGNLTFSPPASTMMACPAPLDALERAFGAALAEVAGFEIEGEALILTDARGVARAIFTAVYF